MTVERADNAVEVPSGAPPAGAVSDEPERLLRDALEDVLIILGNPDGYCDNDRTEVAHAIARIERALGRRPAPEAVPLRRVEPR